MTYYPDLSPCDYFGPNQSALLAVGWLAAGQTYARGVVRTDFFDALVRLLVDPWQPAAHAGRAYCPFCRFTGGPTQLRYGQLSISLGSSNLFVPDAEAVYVCPSLLAHYVDAHEYCPPAPFQDAVVACPEMRSMSYLKAMHKHRVAERLLSKVRTADEG